MQRKEHIASMKRRSWLAVATALAFIPALSSTADDLFQLFWRGYVYTKNSSGHIVAVSFTEQDFVNKVAQDNGLDPSTLIFVYRPDRRDTVVVRQNGTFVADVIQMEYTWTDIVNPNGNAIVRHALLFDEAHQAALGSFFGLETPSRDASGNLVNDSLVGTVMYSKPDQGTIYVAHISTGNRVVDTSGAPTP
jgi:hypothetical protein